MGWATEGPRDVLKAIDCTGEKAHEERKGAAKQ